MGIQRGTQPITERSLSAKQGSQDSSRHSHAYCWGGEGIPGISEQTRLGGHFSQGMRRGSPDPQGLTEGAPRGADPAPPVIPRYLPRGALHAFWQDCETLLTHWWLLVKSQAMPETLLFAGGCQTSAGRIHPKRGGAWSSARAGDALKWQWQSREGAVGPS